MNRKQRRKAAAKAVRLAKRPANVSVPPMPLLKEILTDGQGYSPAKVKDLLRYAITKAPNNKASIHIAEQAMPKYAFKQPVMEILIKHISRLDEKDNEQGIKVLACRRTLEWFGRMVNGEKLIALRVLLGKVKQAFANAINKYAYIKEAINKEKLVVAQTLKANALMARDTNFKDANARKEGYRVVYHD